VSALANGIDGEYWRIMSHDQKIAMMEGITLGSEVDYFLAFRDSPVCQGISDKNEKTLPNLSMAGLATEVDVFYSDEANRPIAVSMAVVYLFMRLRGDSKRDLEAFRSMALLLDKVGKQTK
jgi:hypothetical protein